MTTLDAMTARAQPSPLEHLQTMIQDHAGPAREWRTKLPTLRAQASATSFKLGELARTPAASSVPERGYADVVLAAPNKEWAEDVANRLRDALPAEVRVELGVPGEPLRDGQPLTGFTVSCQVLLPGVSGTAVTRQVRAVLAKIESLETDYSEPLDLVVVAPSG
jgi:hypothetical protein